MAGLTELLSGVTEDTNGTAVTQYGGPLVAYVQSTNYGSGTVTFQSSVDGGTVWHAMKLASGGDAAFTANGMALLEPAGQGAAIRAILAGSTSPDALTAYVAHAS